MAMVQGLETSCSEWLARGAGGGGTITTPGVGAGVHAQGHMVDTPAQTQTNLVSVTVFLQLS
jgi:hypothetical protein